MKKTIAALTALIFAVISLNSCSKSSLSGDGKIKDSDEKPSTIASNTSIEHNWLENGNEFVDAATSHITWLNDGTHEANFILPATIEAGSDEVLRSSLVFASTGKSVSVEKKNMSFQKNDTTIYSHVRTREEKFGETTISMNTSWMNGTIQVGNEKLNLAYVRLDSIVSFPEQTKVTKLEEEGDVRRYSFGMPHKAYYTAKTTRGEERISKGFTVNGTFLYKEAANDEPSPEQPNTPDEPVVEPTPEKNFVDAEAVARRFDLNEQKSFITLNCTWSDGSKSQVEVWVSLTFGWSFPAETTINGTSEVTKFEKLLQDSNPNKEQYKETSETNASEYGKVLRRKVSRKTSFIFSTFTEELNSYHHEANLVINGKNFTFLSPAESISAGNHEQSVSKNGTTSTEKNTVKANILFNQSNFHSSGIVNVLREERKDENPGIEMPSAYGTITGVMGVSRVCEISSKSPVWHTCVTFRTSKGQIRVIDETTVSFISFDEAYDDDRMYSGAYQNGTLYPSTINIDSTGWTYLAETKSGVAFAVEMSDQLAINSGIKNFAKNNSAKPSPIVEYTHNTKNGTWTVSYKINGTAKTVTVK